MKLERNADDFGREFWAWTGGSEILEKQGRKIREIHSLAKFAEKFTSNFPQNSPDQIEEFTPNPLCRPSGSKNKPKIPP